MFSGVVNQGEDEDVFQFEYKGEGYHSDPNKKVSSPGGSLPTIAQLQCCWLCYYTDLTLNSSSHTSSILCHSTLKKALFVQDLRWRAVCYTAGGSSEAAGRSACCL